MCDEDLYSKVFEHNREWVESCLAEDPDYFKRMAAEQHPQILFIGCSDSRVPATSIMGVEPGEVFVHRNVANLVVNTDSNIHAVLHYAVDYLNVDHVVVCGHYGCGGVKASLQPIDRGVLNGWLREVRDVYRLHREELDAIDDEDQRQRRLVELNVEEQCINIIKTAVVQRHYLKRNKFPRVHGWVYDISTGLIEDLEIPFEETMEGVRELYSLNPED